MHLPFSGQEMKYIICSGILQQCVRNLSGAIELLIVQCAAVNLSDLTVKAAKLSTINK